MHSSPGLLILGASGGVAHALLQLLPAYRHELGALVLVDKHAHVTVSPFLDHRALSYTFIEHTLDIRQSDAGLAPIFAQRQHAIDIVLDLTDLQTLPVLTAAHRAGVSYINTMLNDDRIPVPELHTRILERKRDFATRPHLLCVGMNPGVVNHWVDLGVRRDGCPREIVFFEFDSSAPANASLHDCAPFITWSRKEFLQEVVREPGGSIGREGHIEWILPNALSRLVDMRGLLKPIVNLPAYPRGMVLLHEEVVSIGRRLETPASFVYGIHPASLAALHASILNNKPLVANDLVLADNVKVPLVGSDLVGVWLKYDDKDVCLFNVMHNHGLRGTNATYRQVAIGVLAGLRAMVHRQTLRGLHFPEELRSPAFAETVRSHLVVEERIVWKRQPAGRSIQQASPAWRHV